MGGFVVWQGFWHVVYKPILEKYLLYFNTQYSYGVISVLVLLIGNVPFGGLVIDMNGYSHVYN